jgi:hypothetical protein
MLGGRPTGCENSSEPMGLFDRIFISKNDKGHLEVHKDGMPPMSKAFARGAEMKAEGFASLKEKARQDAEKQHAALEELESAEAQGQAIDERLMEEAREKATAYGNLMAVFAFEGRDLGESVKMAIASAEDLLAKSHGDLAKAKARELIEELKRL